MGRQLGAFDPEDELDRPDLNKCPDCGCYFASLDCPLCGKPCPPEMMAGARVEEKKKKRKTTRNSSGRVTFIAWYHRWWVILIAMFVFPILGIVLMATSPYRKAWKAVVITLAVVVLVLEYTGIGNLLLNEWLYKPDTAVNQKLSPEEYRETCVSVEADAFFRAEAAEGYHSMRLTVDCSVSVEYYHSPFGLYGDVAAGYLCHAPDDPGVVVFVADCRGSDRFALKTGDVITVWGQTDGNGPVSYEVDGHTVTGPCVYARFISLQTGAK